MDRMSLRGLGVVSSFVFAAAAVGCGSSDSGGGTTGDSGVHGDSSSTTDSGVPGDSSTDSGKSDSGVGDSSTTEGGTDSSTDGSSDVATDGAPDSGTETSADASVDVGPGTTTGTNLVPGAFALLNVTSDDQILFVKADFTGGLQQIALTGTTPAVVDASFDPTTSPLLVSSSDALVFDGLDATSNAGTLTVWSAAAGAHALSTNALAATGAQSANADGSYVMFADNAATDGSSADLTVVKNDGTGKTAVFTGTAFDGSCRTSVSPLGSSFLVVHCASGGTAAVDAVSATGTVTSIAADGAVATTDDAGDKIAFVTSTGAAKLVPSTGGTPTDVDTNVATVALSADGSTLLYFTTTDGGTTYTAKKTSTSTVSPVTIASSLSLAQLLSLTPSLSAFLYSSVAVDTSTFTSDVNLLPTAAGSTSVALVSDTTTGAVFGSGFSTDGSLALYYSAVDADDVGTFQASASSGTGTAKTLATRVWTDLAATGTKVVFNDNYDATSSVADLRVVDAAATTPAPTAIATRADLRFALSHALDKVVYTSNTATAPGLYVAPLP